MPQIELSNQLYERLTATAEQAGMSILDYLDSHVPELSQVHAAEKLSDNIIFLRTILNNLATQIAILNKMGEIIYVNQAWLDFAEENSGNFDAVSIGINYLKVCDSATGEGSEDAKSFAAGIRSIISGEFSTYSLEYPCHSPQEQRWFIGRADAMVGNTGTILVAHENITARKLNEVEARENGARYRAIVENFPNGMVALYDKDLIYTLAEGQGLAQVGMTSADLVGKRLRDVFPPDVYERDEPALLAALEGEVIDTLVAYTGQFFRVTTLPVKDSDGTIINGMVLTQNITALIVAEENQKETLAQLELALSIAKLGVWSMNVKTGELIWSQRQLEIYGLTEDNFDPHFDNFIDYVHPDDRQHVDDILQKLLTTAAIQNEKFRINRPNGEIRYIETSGYGVYDETGEIVKIVGINRDVTELERSKQELKASEERYRSLFNGSLNPVVIYDRDARFVMVNDIAVKNLGLPREEIIGKRLGDFIPQNQDMTVERISRVLAKQEAIFVEDKIELAEGEVWYWSVIQPVFSEAADISEVQIISYDITERKQAESLETERAQLTLQLKQEQEVAELRDKLFSIISHEFRTPLAIISSSSQMLVRYFDRLNPDELANKVSKIEKQVRHLDRLLVEVTLLAKFNSQFFELNPVPVDIQKLYQNIIGDMEDVITNEHDIQIELELRDKYIVGDEKLLYHALMNIFSNAIKYSPNGGKIILRVLQTDRDWRFITKDSGIGIPPEDQKDLFKVFTRASNVDAIVGTGIGLSLVKEIAELHGGSVELNSKVGEGSTFTVIIPFSEEA